ncbi:MAG: transposase [Bryobacter sp.]|nr:transposase [Bryobacter sp. CoA8 C33]
MVDLFVAAGCLSSITLPNLGSGGKDSISTIRHGDGCGKPLSQPFSFGATIRLKWRRLKTFEKLAQTLLRHEEGLLNYCRVKVPFGVVEAVNGKIKALMRRGRGCAACATYCSRLSRWRLSRPNLWS